jgi:hypothetical protein
MNKFGSILSDVFLSYYRRARMNKFESIASDVFLVVADQPGCTCLSCDR